MLEKDLESRFRERVRQAGCKALKFVSPGNAGVPDRIVLAPGGKACFVELKKKGRKPRPLQMHAMQELRELGFEVYVIDSLPAVEVFSRKLEAWRWG